MTTERLDALEERLYAIEDLMRRFVDEVIFNGAIVLDIARRSGIELPFGADKISAKAADLRERIDAASRTICQHPRIPCTPTATPGSIRSRSVRSHSTAPLCRCSRCSPPLRLAGAPRPRRPRAGRSPRSVPRPAVRYCVRPFRGACQTTYFLYTSATNFLYRFLRGLGGARASHRRQCLMFPTG